MPHPSTSNKKINYSFKFPIFSILFTQFAGSHSSSQHLPSQQADLLPLLLKMLSTFLRFAVGLYALQTVSAQTPPNFTPAISNHLSVTYGTVAINPAGITIPAPG